MTVYLILDEVVGLLKVGVTQDVKRRFNQLRRGTNNPLRLVATFDGMGAAHERVFHNFLRGKGLHVRLEWFLYSDECRRCLAALHALFTREKARPINGWVDPHRTLFRLEVQLEEKWIDFAEVSDAR